MHKLLRIKINENLRMLHSPHHRVFSYYSWPSRPSNFRPRKSVSSVTSIIAARISLRYFSVRSSIDLDFSGIQGFAEEWILNGVGAYEVYFTRKQSLQFIDKIKIIIGIIQ